MALTHRITIRVDLQHEPGEWLEARMPSLDILDRAKQARSRKALELMAGIDMSQLRGMASDQPADTAQECDWQTLLRLCLTAWSYPDPLIPANIVELDEKTVAAIMSALLPTETEADVKKGSEGSTMR